MEQKFYKCKCCGQIVAMVEKKKCPIYCCNKEMEELINELRECENPYNCPHGRPTMISYTNYDLEKLFKRSGF